MSEEKTIDVVDALRRLAGWSNPWKGENYFVASRKEMRRAADEIEMLRGELRKVQVERKWQFDEIERLRGADAKLKKLEEEVAELKKGECDWKTPWGG